MAGISVDDRIEKIREKYKDRECIWCDDKPKKDCNDDCECIFCCFPDKVYTWEEYPNLNECIRKDIQFFNDLFDAGLIKEDNLAKNWRRTQLPVLRSVGSEIKDWTAFDLESSGERKIIPNSPEDFTILSPYLKKYPDRKRNDGYPFHCGLCNQGNNTQYFIKNIAKKQCIALGGNCGYAFHYSDQVAEDIRFYMGKIMLQIFEKRLTTIQKQIKEKLSTNSNDTWLKSIPKRLRNHATKRTYIRPEDLAELLLTLEDRGIIIFDEKNNFKGKSIIKYKSKPTVTKSKKLEEQKIPETPLKTVENKFKEFSLIEDYRIIIMEIIKKIRGPERFAVTKNQIIQALAKHRMTEKQIKEYLTRMLERNDIFEFIPNSYKIPE